MPMITYENPEAFFSDNQDVILAHILRAELVYLTARGSTDACPGFFGASIRDERGILLAVQKPPYPMILFQTGDAPQPRARELTGYLVKAGRIPTMLNGDIASTAAIVGAFAASGIAFRAGRRLIQRKCETLADIPTANLQLVCTKDIEYDFTEDYRGFVTECHAVHRPESIRKDALAIARSGDLYALVDRDAVVAAGRLQRSLPQGRAVGMVYTPPQYRGMGYATCCVKQLTRRVFRDGYAFAFLYAELANPAANHIYDKLGYEKTDTYIEYHRTD